MFSNQHLYFSTQPNSNRLRSFILGSRKSTVIAPNIPNKMRVWLWLEHTILETVQQKWVFSCGTTTVETRGATAANIFCINDRFTNGNPGGDSIVEMRIRFGARLLLFDVCVRVNTEQVNLGGRNEWETEKNRGKKRKSEGVDCANNNRIANRVNRPAQINNTIPAILHNSNFFSKRAHSRVCVPCEPCELGHVLYHHRVCVFRVYVFDRKTILDTLSNTLAHAVSWGATFWECENV